MNTYTCPMHPEVRQAGPGSCPKCGMALEPGIPQASSTRPDPELRWMTIRFWVSSALSLPVFFLGMLYRHPPRTMTWVELSLATPVVVWGGWPFFVRAWQSLQNRSLNMFTLIGLGTAAAYLYSLGIALSGSSLPVYLESAAMITTLVLLGQVMELRARAATSSALR